MESILSPSVCADCELQPHWPGPVPKMADIEPSVADVVQTMQTRPRSLPRNEGAPFVTTKDWSLGGLLERSERFFPVRRVSAALSAQELAAELARFEKDGVPLIIEGYHERPGWPKHLLNVDWLLGQDLPEVRTRNVRDWTDGKMCMKDFISTSRSTSPYASPNEITRLYGKDVDCPKEWQDWLESSDVLPSVLLEQHEDNLMQCLPQDEKVETLMCYFGIGDTFTPAHKDLCASTGHNLMCYTENSGSSFWFMTSGSAAHDVSQYFQGLGQELDLETHVVTIEELAKAESFDVYIAEQKLGDLVLVPPRSCHQVVNHGGITIKTSWSRMTLDGLTTALYHELPIYRRVCRPETYRVKSAVYHAMMRYSQELWSSMKPSGNRQSGPSTSTTPIMSESRFPTSSARCTSLSSRAATPVGHAARCKEKQSHALRKLVGLFDEIIIEEFHPEHAQLEHPLSNPQNWQGVCDFCGCDIFQSFFECRNCVSAKSDGPVIPGDGLIICPACYVEGRICKCECMVPLQRFKLHDLVSKRNEAAIALLGTNHRRSTISPANLRIENLPHKDSDGIQRLRVFEAASVLHQLRQQARDKRQTRTCRSRQGGIIWSHALCYLSVLPCKKCHSALCFRHALLLGIHSASALLKRREDASSDEMWHEFHTTNKREFLSRRRQVRDAEIRGERWRLDDRLALVASEFNVCRPANERWTKLGWYDNYIQVSGSRGHFLKVPVDESRTIAPGRSVVSSPLTEIETSPDTALDQESELMECQTDPAAAIPAARALPISSDIPAVSSTSTLIFEGDAEVEQYRTWTCRLLLECVEIPARKRQSPTSNGQGRKKAKRTTPVYDAGSADQAQVDYGSSGPIMTSGCTQSLASIFASQTRRNDLARENPATSSAARSTSPDLQLSSKPSFRKTKLRKGPPGERGHDSVAFTYNTYHSTCGKLKSPHQTTQLSPGLKFGRGSRSSNVASGADVEAPAPSLEGENNDGSVGTERRPPSAEVVATSRTQEIFFAPSSPDSSSNRQPSSNAVQVMEARCKGRVQGRPSSSHQVDKLVDATGTSGPGGYNLHSPVAEDELSQTREELRETREELGEAQEELAKTRDELRDIRDELRRTREELTNTREGLHTRITGFEEKQQLLTEQAQRHSDQIKECLQVMMRNSSEHHHHVSAVNLDDRPYSRDVRMCMLEEQVRTVQSRLDNAHTAQTLLLSLPSQYVVPQATPFYPVVGPSGFREFNQDQHQFRQPQTLPPSNPRPRGRHGRGGYHFSRGAGRFRGRPQNHAPPYHHRHHSDSYSTNRWGRNEPPSRPAYLSRDDHTRTKAPISHDYNSSRPSDSMNARRGQSWSQGEERPFISSSRGSSVDPVGRERFTRETSTAPSTTSHWEDGYEQDVDSLMLSSKKMPSASACIGNAAHSLRGDIQIQTAGHTTSAELEMGPNPWRL